MALSVLLAAFLALAPPGADEPLVDHQPVECTVPEKNARICAYVLDDGEVKRRPRLLSRPESRRLLLE